MTLPSIPGWLSRFLGVAVCDSLVWMFRWPVLGRIANDE